MRAAIAMAEPTYYIDENCIDCDLCHETAPAMFARDDDEGRSVVTRPPPPKRNSPSTARPPRPAPSRPSARTTDAPRRQPSEFDPPGGPS